MIRFYLQPEVKDRPDEMDPRRYLIFVIVDGLYRKISPEVMVLP